VVCMVDSSLETSSTFTKIRLIMESFRTNME